MSLPLALPVVAVGLDAEGGWSWRCNRDEYRAVGAVAAAVDVRRPGQRPCVRGGGGDPRGADLLAKAHDWGFPEIPKSWHRCPSAADGDLAQVWPSGYGLA
jgi:hypothetical protein